MTRTMHDNQSGPATGSDAIESAETNLQGSQRAMRLTGWRHSALWTYAVMLVASAAALVVSFVLSAETLVMARNPGMKLGCDVNGVVSCSSVAQSWQSEIIKFADLSFPNAFFGIAAESVFVTVAVIGMARVAVPRWFAICTWLGGLSALAYAYWLFTQSMYVIHALCPWCLALMFSTTIQFMALSHATVAVQQLPATRRGTRGAQQREESGNGSDASFTPSVPHGLGTYYRLNYDLMIDALWLVVLVALILLQYGDVLF